MKRPLFHLPAGGLTGNQLLLAVVAFLILAGNLTFFGAVLDTYRPLAGKWLPLATLPLFAGAVTVLALGLFACGRLAKPVLTTILVLSALAAYFMDTFGVVLDADMLDNAAQTQAAEVADLINPKAIAYLVLLGLLPAAAVIAVPMRWRGWKRELGARLLVLGVSFAVLAGVVFGFSDFYASFLREHKSLRSYANPTFYLYSAWRFAERRIADDSQAPVAMKGTDARNPERDTHRELVLVVVGETARADRFGLNGYARDTTPRLARENVISFTRFISCGTSTAVSVPCMFSLLGREDYDDKQARRQENVLDVLAHSGAHVLWLDNNSDSKGVAARIEYRNLRKPENNPVCDTECRDVGMLTRLQETIDAHPTGDLVIVLHQMGNHGPAYYKRYPDAFEKFRPACKSNDLSQCSKAEIDNAYDNAILYTDHFLGEAIELLKRNDGPFETVLFYVSDHGESLGENGIYLHGFPYALAPDAQTHVPAVMWFGPSYADADVASLRTRREQPYSHDNLPHTLLGLLELNTGEYRRELDILDGLHRDDH